MTHMTSIRKVLVPILNRAHYGRLRPVLKAIKNHPALDLKIIVGVPAAYGYFFKNLINSQPHSWVKALPWYILARARSFLGSSFVFKNDFLANNLISDGFKLESYAPIFFDGGKSETMAYTAALGIECMTREIKKIKPDIIFVNADRFEMMSVAIAASYLNVPIAHNEGGDVTGTTDEKIRHAITKLANIHFTSTKLSYDNVIKMGENEKKVFAYGSPAIDAVAKVNFSKIPAVFPSLDVSQPYLLVLAHPVATRSREDNVSSSKNLVSAITELGMPTIVLGSNIDAGSDVLGGVIKDWIEKEKPKNIFFTKNLKPEEFYWYLKNAACAIGNSSSFIREGAYLGTPVVLVGSRQGNRERSDNIEEVEGNGSDLKKAIIAQINKKGSFPPSYIFGDGTAAYKIADKLAGIDLEIEKTLKFNR